MCDPILEARIDTLLKSLERPKAMSEFVRSLDDGYSHLDRVKWNQIKERLAKELVNEIDKRIDSLRAIKTELALARFRNAEGQAEAVSEAWRSYRDTSEQIPGSLSRMPGRSGWTGLPRTEPQERNLQQGDRQEHPERGRGADLGVFKLDGYRFPSLVIPAPKEALVMTLGRVVRLRWCDWTLWALPLSPTNLGTSSSGTPPTRES